MLFVVISFCSYKFKLPLFYSFVFLIGKLCSRRIFSAIPSHTVRSSTLPHSHGFADTPWFALSPSSPLRLYCFVTFILLSLFFLLWVYSYKKNTRTSCSIFSRTTTPDGWRRAQPSNKKEKGRIIFLCFLPFVFFVITSH